MATIEEREERRKAKLEALRAEIQKGSIVGLLPTRTSE